MSIFNRFVSRFQKMEAWCGGIPRIRFTGLKFHNKALTTASAIQMFGELNILRNKIGDSKYLDVAISTDDIKGFWQSKRGLYRYINPKSEPKHVIESNIDEKMSAHYIYEPQKLLSEGHNLYQMTQQLYKGGFIKMKYNPLFPQLPYLGKDVIVLTEDLYFYIFKL